MGRHWDRSSKPRRAAKGVDLDGSDRCRNGVGVEPHASAQQQPFHPCRQFLHQERLFDTVIGATIQQLLRGWRSVLIVQCDDGRRACRACLAHEFGAAKIGELDRQHDQIRSDLSGTGDRRYACICGCHVISGRAQRPPKQPQNAPVRTGDEDRYRARHKPVSGSHDSHRFRSVANPWACC